MSFLRPELEASLRRWREPLGWTALALAGAWFAWRGYARVEPTLFAFGVLLAGASIGLLRGAVRRVRLRPDAPAEGMVVIDEARIAYLGPRTGGVVDLPSVVRVELVSRPHVPQASAHAWVITAEDGTRLVIPLGAAGAEGLLDALSPLPGIDFDAGAAAIAGRGPHRTVVWRKAG